MTGRHAGEIPELRLVGALPIRLQCVLVTASRVKRDRKLVPVPRVVEWIERHGLAEQLGALFGSTGNSKHASHERKAVGVIGVERQCSLKVHEGQIEIAAEAVGLGEELMATALAGIQPNRCEALAEGAFLDLIRRAVVTVLDKQGHGQIRMGQCEARIEFDRSLEQLSGRNIVGAVAAAQQLHAAQEEIIGRQIVGPPVRCPLYLNALNAPGYGRHDRARDFVLDGEEILHIAIVTLAPDMIAGDSVDELRGNSDARSRWCGRCPRRHTARRVPVRPA